MVGAGVVCFVQRALKRQSLRHKKEMVALVDITEHPSELAVWKSILLIQLQINVVLEIPGS